MKKHKNKLKRFISFFLCCLVISSIFLISATAVTPTGTTALYPFNVSSIDVEVLDNNGDFIPLDIRALGYNVETGRVRWEIRRNDGISWTDGDKYFIAVSLAVTDDLYSNGELCVSASYGISVGSNLYINTVSNNVFNRAETWGNGIIADGIYEKKEYNRISVQYPYSEKGEKLGAYYNRFRVTCTSTKSYFTLNLFDVKFSAITQETKNSMDIIANQDKNTDKILNGGHDDPPYEAAPDSLIKDYISNESGLMDSISGGLDDLHDMFNGFMGTISPGTAQGLAVVSNFMNGFLNIPQFAMIWKIALTLGLLAFVIGTVQLVGRVVSRKGG